MDNRDRDRNYSTPTSETKSTEVPKVKKLLPWMKGAAKVRPPTNPPNSQLSTQSSTQPRQSDLPNPVEATRDIPVIEITNDSVPVSTKSTISVTPPPPANPIENCAKETKMPTSTEPATKTSAPFVQRKSKFAAPDAKTGEDVEPPIGKDVTLRINNRMGVKLTITIHTSKKILDLKKIVAEKTGRHVEKINLTRARMSLQDSVTLADYELVSDGISLELT